ncbi:unnamed protein product [Prorocentrum cordatum]|uniref:Reverse transcriptase domain-containing protein n=1 Tax=Prorocentrum cordatum TaxID=2364126 RepID=A0ABN9UK22_9DINO|nr:unnamed protein product [Polarella glacialis]
MGADGYPGALWACACGTTDDHPWRTWCRGCGKAAPRTSSVVTYQWQQNKRKRTPNQQGKQQGQRQTQWWTQPRAQGWWTQPGEWPALAAAPRPRAAAQAPAANHVEDLARLCEKLHKEGVVDQEVLAAVQGAKAKAAQAAEAAKPDKGLDDQLRAVQCKITHKERTVARAAEHVEETRKELADAQANFKAAEQAAQERADELRALTEKRVVLLQQMSAKASEITDRAKEDSEFMQAYNELKDAQWKARESERALREKYKDHFASVPAPGGPLAEPEATDPMDLDAEAQEKFFEDWCKGVGIDKDVMAQNMGDNLSVADRVRKLCERYLWVILERKSQPPGAPARRKRRRGKLSKGIEIYTANCNTWAKGIAFVDEYITKPSCILGEEHRLDDKWKEEVQAATCKRAWAIAMAPSATGARGGRSAGTYIAVPKSIGLTYAYGQQERVCSPTGTRGRICAARCPLWGTGGVLLVSAYMWTGEGLSERSLQILDRIGELIEMHAVPWILGMAVQMDTRTLHESGWLQAERVGDSEVTPHWPVQMRCLKQPREAKVLRFIKPGRRGRSTTRADLTMGDLDNYWRQVSRTAEEELMGICQIPEEERPRYRGRGDAPKTVLTPLLGPKARDGAGQAVGATAWRWAANKIGSHIYVAQAARAKRPDPIRVAWLRECLNKALHRGRHRLRQLRATGQWLDHLLFDVEHWRLREDGAEERLTAVMEIRRWLLKQANKIVSAVAQERAKAWRGRLKDGSKGAAGFLHRMARWRHAERPPAPIANYKKDEIELLDGQTLVDGHAHQWYQLWASHGADSRGEHDRPWEGRVFPAPLVRVLADRFREAARLFKTRIGIGPDWWHPRWWTWLSSEGIQALVDLAEYILRHLHWPTQVELLAYFLVPKPHEDGRRPLVLLCSLVRVVETLMADEYRKWEEIVARPYDWASRGKGAEGAMWDLMLRDESCPEDHINAAVVKDLSKAFEHVTMRRLWEHGRKLEMPEQVLHFMISIFTMERVVTLDGMVASTRMRTWSAAAAGSRGGIRALKCFTIILLDMVNARCVKLYVDDATLHLQGEREAVVHEAKGSAMASLCRFTTHKNGVTKKGKSYVYTADKQAKAKFKLWAKDWGLEIQDEGVQLGVDFTGGVVAQRRPKQRERVGVMVTRGTKLSILKKQGASFGTVVWSRAMDEDAMVAAWRKASARLATTGTVAWSAVRDPAEAVLRTLRDLGWSWPAPWTLLTPAGDQVSLHTVAPKTVRYKLERAIERRVRAKCATEKGIAEEVQMSFLEPVRALLKKRRWAAHQGAIKAYVGQDYCTQAKLQQRGTVADGMCQQRRRALGTQRHRFGRCEAHEESRAKLADKHAGIAQRMAGSGESLQLNCGLVAHPIHDVEGDTQIEQYHSVNAEGDDVSEDDVGPFISGVCFTDGSGKGATTLKGYGWGYMWFEEPAGEGQCTALGGACGSLPGVRADLSVGRAELQAI